MSKDGNPNELQSQFLKELVGQAKGGGKSSSSSRRRRRRSKRRQQKVDKAQREVQSTPQKENENQRQSRSSQAPQKLARRRSSAPEKKKTRAPEREGDSLIPRGSEEFKRAFILAELIAKPPPGLSEDW